MFEYLTFFNISFSSSLLLLVFNFVPTFLIKGLFTGLFVSFIFTFVSMLFIGYETMKEILEGLPNWLAYSLIFSLVMLFWLKYSIDFYWNFEKGLNLVKG